MREKTDVPVAVDCAKWGKLLTALMLAVMVLWVLNWNLMLCWVGELNTMAARFACGFENAPITDFAAFFTLKQLPQQEKGFIRDIMPA